MFHKSVLVALALLALLTLGVAQDKDEATIEAQRQEQLKRWGADKLTRPPEIAKRATNLLSLPLDKQSVGDLTELAAEANKAANLIGFILEEYEDYNRENYRYDFVRKKLAPYYNAYVELTNKFKGFRNQAYFNLGLKHKKAGNEVAAFFYFRDAFRLSTFTKTDGDHKGMRYKAEVEMKKLLGYEGVGTFVYWE